MREELVRRAAISRSASARRTRKGRWLFPVKGALDPNDIAIAIGERLMKYPPERGTRERARPRQAARRPRSPRSRRSPCARPISARAARTTARPRCPKARAPMPASAAITWRSGWTARTDGFTQMGGEGANWVGEAPFSTRGHVFQNLGDGTYNHSGTLAHALRGRFQGQHHLQDPVQRRGRHDRRPAPRGRPHACRRSPARSPPKASSASPSSPTSPANIAPETPWPAGHHDPPARRPRSRSQRELGEVPGVTVLIYDQTCAAEKRRRRKRGAYPDPDKRVIINELVCEGCGDCGVKSNCVSVQPLETEFGRKRDDRPVELQQGFLLRQRILPVLRHRAWREARKAVARRPGAAAPSPEPVTPRARPSGPMAIIVTGVGGTGVVTIGAILGMAAHLEGKGCGMIDMAGLAQKGGAVFSHVKLARTPGGHPRHPRRRRARPTSCSAATSSSPAPRRCWRRVRSGDDRLRRQHGRGLSRRFHPQRRISRCRPSA